MPPNAIRCDGDVLSRHLDLAGPAAGLGEAHGVEQYAAVAPHVLARLLEGRDRALPHEIEGEVVVVGLEHEAQARERLEHLHAEGADGVVHAVAELSRCPHHVVPAPAADDREGVLHREVRVLAHPHHQEQLVARTVEVEVVAIVEIAIAGSRVPDGLRHLVNRVIVPTRKHDPPPPQRRAMLARIRDRLGGDPRPRSSLAGRSSGRRRVSFLRWIQHRTWRPDLLCVCSRRRKFASRARTCSPLWRRSPE